MWDFQSFGSALFRQMASLFRIEGGIVKIDCTGTLGKSLGENRGLSREKRKRAKMISLKKEIVEFDFFYIFLLLKSRLCQLFLKYWREEPLVTKKSNALGFFLCHFFRCHFLMRSIVAWSSIFLVLSLHEKRCWVKKKSGKSWFRYFFRQNSISLWGKPSNTTLKKLT